MSRSLSENPQDVKPHTLTEFLNQQAARYGELPALVYKPAFRYRKTSYARLWQWSGEVASLLQQIGISQGDRVFIWAHNCPEWVAAFFGIIRAGGIAVPVDLRSGIDFVQDVIARTDPKLAFISRVTPVDSGTLEMPKIALETLMNWKPAAEPAPISSNPDDLVEIMFTSGTTGNPKGVTISHRNLLANMEGVHRIVPPTPDSRMLSVLPLSHMFEQMAGLLVPLMGGASVTYPVSRQPSILFKTMQERQINMMLVVPQALSLFMNGIEREVQRQGKEAAWQQLHRVAPLLPMRVRRRMFRSVHQRFGGKLGLLYAGGAALDPGVAKKWEAMGVRVLQGYGATEASPVICGHSLQRPRWDSAGPPLHNVELRLAEDGEVQVRGPNITNGYWNDQAQTTSSFTDGWYMTGDLGQIDRHGSLHIRGRKKNMIVLASGQNVFPEDIEAVLVQHEAVRDAVVVGVPNGADTEVHAVIIPADEAADPQAAVTWTNRRVAEHQRIRRFTLWPSDDFPRTHTLKVKKQEIIDAIAGIAPAARTPATPATAGGDDAVSPVLRIVAEVAGKPASEVLAGSMMGEDLGLDSLGRVEVLSAIDAELGAFLDEAQVDPETTVGDLERMVQEGSQQSAAPSFPNWGRNRAVCHIRRGIQAALLFPAMRWMYRLDVSGLENLADVKSPVIIAPNHQLLLDNPLLIKAMPLRVRRRLAIAGWDELWKSRFSGFTNTLVGNGFPFSKGGAVRHSFENLGKILDEGWSVMIFPEGELTVGGPMKPFLSGVGLISVEGNVPVVPVRLDIRRVGFPKHFPVFRRGHVEIHFGKSRVFNADVPYDEAARAIERAVAEL